MMSAVNVYATSYTVTYTPNGGSGSNTTQTVTYNVDWTTKSAIYARNGYILVGWTTTPNGEFMYSLNTPQGKWLSNNNLTLYAVWHAKQYTVIYNANGGTGSNVSQTVKYNTDWTTKPAIYTRTGYTLVGWSTSPNGGLTHNLNTPQGKWLDTNNLTLYAVWQLKQYTVTYNANGGTGSNTTQTVTYNVDWTTRPALYTRSGYTLVGWTTTPNGEFMYSLNTPQGKWLSNNNLTLYAVWHAKQYTVTYNANGGTGSNVSQTVKYNTDWTTKPILFDKEGYVQAGWSTSPNGGLTHNLNMPQGKWLSTNNLTLYAVWQIDNRYIITRDNKYSNYTDIDSYNSRTLKYRIFEYSGQDIVLIWVDNAFAQLNGALATSDALHSSSAEIILSNEISNYNYQNKGMIAVNASFYYPTNLYNGTPNGGVVINHGTIVKNTGLSAKVIGLNSSGILSEYENLSASTIYNAGVRNTFVISSKTSEDDTIEYKNRTQICQYDEHNFAIISGEGRVSQVGNQLMNLTGCETVYNLDGGWSRKLYYKTSSMLNAKKEFGGDRKIPDMLYFVEQ